MIFSEIHRILAIVLRYTLTLVVCEMSGEKVNVNTIKKNFNVVIGLVRFLTIYKFKTKENTSPKHKNSIRKKVEAEKF